MMQTGLEKCPKCGHLKVRKVDCHTCLVLDGRKK